MRVDAHKIYTSSPSDTSELERLLINGVINSEKVVCVIGKTEGNGGRNDFSRELAIKSLEALFAQYLNIPPTLVQERIIFSLSGGTEGVVSPHMIVFTKDQELLSQPRSEKSLIIGVAHTRKFSGHEIGRMEQVEETAIVVRNLVQKLRLDESDVHLVQIKGAIPRYTYDQQIAAEKIGKPILSNMVFSRAASALGVALALNEVKYQQLSDDIICRDWSKYSGVASASAKPGLECTEVIVFGNSAYATSDLIIEHSILNDMIDAPSISRLLSRLNLPCSSQLTLNQQEKVVGVFAKSEADNRGTIRGKRHTMLTDDDISDMRYSRCVLSSVIASILGNTAIYVSTRAEHHGPQGGGSIAIIAKK